MDSKVENKTAGGQIIRKTKLWVSSFQDFKLSFARITANKVARAWACAALSLDRSFLLYTDVPGFQIEAVRSGLFSSIE